MYICIYIYIYTYIYIYIYREREREREISVKEGFLFSGSPLSDPPPWGAAKHS